MVYSEEYKVTILNFIFEEISKGSSLLSILRENDNMPNRSTFYEWVDANKEYANNYVRACEARADTIFDEILDISDDGSNDYMTITKGDMEYNVEDREVTNRSKLRVDARKWVLARMNPTKYGEKIQNDINIRTEQPLFGD